MNQLIKNNYNFKMIIFSMITVLLFSIVMPSISSAKMITKDEQLRLSILNGEKEQYLQNVILEIENEIKSEISSDEVDLEILNLTDITQDKVLINTLITMGESDANVTLELDVKTQNILIDGEVISNNVVETFHANGLVDENYHDITIYEKKNGKKKYHLHSNKANASLAPAVVAAIRLAIKLGKNVIQIYSKAKVIQALASITFKSAQLQKKWNHAIDFGVSGNYNKTNAAKFEEALKKSIDKSTHIYETTISGQPNKVILHFDSKTKLGVFSNQDGEFITGYKLNASQIDFHSRKNLLIKK